MIREYKDPRKVFGSAVSEFAEENKDVVILSADSGGSSGFKEFAKAHPDRYFEFGIMEQCVTGIASGMATTGKIPVFCAIAPFVTCRNYEMFRNDLGYMRQNVKIVGRNCGITYSDLGATHHSLEDFAIMRMIPGVTVLAPQTPSEIKAASIAMLKHKGPVYMRIGNPKIPELWDNEEEFEIGKGKVLCEGNDVTIISTGSTTAAAIDAVNILSKQGIFARLVGMPTIQPVDRGIIIDSAKKTGKIVTVEEHYIDGGLGSAVAAVTSEYCPVPVKMHGIPKDYATSGPYDELIAYYKLDGKGIAETVLDFIKL